MTLNNIKKKIVKHKKVIIFFLFLLLFFLILNDIFSKEIIIYDEWAYSIFVEHLRNDYLTKIMLFITSLGGVLSLILVSLLPFFISKDKKDGVSSIINLIVITIVNLILKIAIQRSRPSGFNLIVESGYSFPSGHSMISTAVYGFFIYLVYKNVKNKILRNLLCLFFFMLIISICISRIYLGVHYASDVIGGFCISIAYLMVFVIAVPKILKFLENKLKKEKK